MINAMATVGETANPTSPEMKATGSVTPRCQLLVSISRSLPLQSQPQRQYTDIVDKVIAMGFKMEKDLKENEVDE